MSLSVTGLLVIKKDFVPVYFTEFKYEAKV